MRFSLKTSISREVTGIVIAIGMFVVAGLLPKPLQYLGPDILAFNACLIGLVVLANVGLVVEQLKLIDLRLKVLNGDFDETP